MTELTKSKSISLVSTVFNSEDIIIEFVNQVEIELKKNTNNYEIILVEDFSFDNSWQIIENICQENNLVRGIKLSRNFGQQIAMSVGIGKATGDFVIIMDGDLQNPPSAISKILEELKNGNEIVYTVSNKRNNFKNKISSKLFWYVLTKILKVNIVKNQLMMKGFTKTVVSKFNNYSEINRTISGIVNDIGLRYSIIEVENKNRFSGKSNYNFFTRFNLMIDIIVSMTNTPLNFMIYLGFIIFISTIILSIYFLYKFIFLDITPGFTSLMLSLYFFGGIIIMMLGFMGRYLSNIYTEVRRRPMFTIEKTCNFTS